MELHQIEMVGFELFETALNAVGDRLRGLFLPLIAARDVAAFGCQHILLAAMGDGAPQQFFADVVAGAGVEEVDASIQGNVEYLGGLGFFCQRQAMPNF